MAGEDDRVQPGWGVFRQAPYDLAGVFDSREEAEAKAREVGGDYLVRYGEVREGSDSSTVTHMPGAGS